MQTLKFPLRTPNRLDAIYSKSCESLSVRPESGLQTNVVTIRSSDSEHWKLGVFESVIAVVQALQDRLEIIFEAQSLSPKLRPLKAFEGDKLDDCLKLFSEESSPNETT